MERGAVRRLAARLGLTEPGVIRYRGSPGGACGNAGQLPLGRPGSGRAPRAVSSSGGRYRGAAGVAAGSRCRPIAL